MRVLAALLVLLATSTAVADDADLRQQAEQAAKDARYDDCGDLYIQAFNADASAVDGDELLYDAALCYEQGHDLGPAITLQEQVRNVFPKSPLAARALGKLGRMYAQIAWYGEAAERLEEYAKTYAGEADAYDALNDAVFYRKALGDDDQAIKDTLLFIKTFGAKAKDAAADAMFSLTSIYEKQGDPDKVVAHLERYIEDYGSMDAGRVVIAYTKIGDALWTQSCAVKTIDGSCLQVVRDKKATCSVGVRTSVKKRDAKLVKQATKQLKAAVTAYEAAASRGELAPTTRYFYGRARFLLAEASYEAYLADAYTGGKPKDLDKWLESRLRTSGEASKEYQALLDLGEPATAIAAAARLGQIPLHLGRALEATGNGKDCDARAEKAEPIFEVAKGGLTACLSVSTQLGWWSEWSTLCERELGVLAPAEFPALTEVRAAPVTSMHGLTSLEDP